MKKQYRIRLVFKSQCTSINERISKLEVHLHSRKIRSKTFLPLQNVFLPPSKKITLKNNHFIFPMKNKYICDYDTRYIMSSGLMFDDIIMDHIKIIQSSHNYTEEHDCVFTPIDTDMIYIYRGSLKDFYWKKGTYECIDMPCEHYTIKVTKLKVIGPVYLKRYNIIWNE